jgi:hypothetical protein
MPGATAAVGFGVILKPRGLPGLTGGLENDFTSNDLEVMDFEGILLILDEELLRGANGAFGFFHGDDKLLSVRYTLPHHGSRDVERQWDRTGSGEIVSHPGESVI